MSYPLGSLVPLTWTPATVPASAVVTITLPDLSTSTPSVTGTTTFSANYTPTLAGRHIVRWVGSGGAGAVSLVDVFEVDAATIAPICSLADIKAQLNIPTTVTTNDAEMLTMALALSDAIETYLGFPIRRRTVTELYDGGTDSLALRQTPCPCAICQQYSVLTVSAVTENGVSLVTVTDYILDTRRGMLRRGQYGYGWSWLTLMAEAISVTYSTGYTSTPPWARQAFLRAMANSWQRTQQRPHPGIGQAPMSDEMPGHTPFHLPYYVEAMLSPHKGGGAFA